MASNFYDYPNLTSDPETSPLQEGSKKQPVNQKPALRPWKKLQSEPPIIEDSDNTDLAYSIVDIPFPTTGNSLVFKH